jgi:hypothetical protein
MFVQFLYKHVVIICLHVPLTFYPQSFTNNIICTPMLLVTMPLPSCTLPYSLPALILLSLPIILKGPCCLLRLGSICILSSSIILKIQIWDVMLCPWVCSCQQPEGSYLTFLKLLDSEEGTMTL